MIGFLWGGSGWAAQSAQVEIASGVECEAVEVPGWSSPTDARRFEGGPCDGNAGAWRVRVRLDVATLRVLTGPFEGASIQPASPLNMIHGVDAVARQGSLVAVAAVNGGFFGAAAETDRVVSLSSLAGDGWALPPAVDPARLSAEARCRIARRGAFVLRCRAESCRASIEPEELGTHASDEAAGLFRPPEDLVARLGGGGRLQPQPQSAESVPDCVGGPGQPDPDWDRSRPRTAIGLIERSQPNDGGEPAGAAVVELFVSRSGLTVAELAAVASRLGWSQGLALDGGGSSQLWLRDGVEWWHGGGSRLVASALVVFVPERPPSP